MFSKRFLNLLFVGCLSAASWGLQYNLDEALGTDPNDITYIAGDANGFSPHPPEMTIAAIEFPRSVNWFATATVIAPNYVITAAHWKTILKSDYPNWPLGYKLKRLGGQTLTTEYMIVDEQHHFGNDAMVCRIKKTNPTDPNFNPATWRKLSDPNFAAIAEIYDGNDEAGRAVTIGCFGKIEKYNKPWCECTPEERNSKIKRVKIPGTLHWGRNVIDIMTPPTAKSPMIGFRYDPIGSPRYVQFEACGTEGNSGSPWFIQDGEGSWKLAGFFTSCTTGPRLSGNRDLIAAMIAYMDKQ